MGDSYIASFETAVISGADLVGVVRVLKSPFPDYCQLAEQLDYVALHKLFSHSFNHWMKATNFLRCNFKAIPYRLNISNVSKRNRKVRGENGLIHKGNNVVFAQ